MSRFLILALIALASAYGVGVLAENGDITTGEQVISILLVMIWVSVTMD